MLKDALKLLADKYVRSPDQNETEPPGVSEETGKEGRIFFSGEGDEGRQLLDTLLVSLRSLPKFKLRVDVFVGSLLLHHSPPLVLTVDIREDPLDSHPFLLTPTSDKNGVCY